MEPPEVVRDYEPIHPGTNWRETGKRLLGPIAVALGAIVKYGFAFAKFASIFIAFGGYALLWGWQFGVGIIGLLLTHEMGHYLEARRQGLHPKLPVFVPFLGAYVSFKNENLTPWRHAWIALAGPFVGSIAAAGLLAATVRGLHDPRPAAGHHREAGIGEPAPRLARPLVRRVPLGDPRRAVQRHRRAADPVDRLEALPELLRDHRHVPVEVGLDPLEDRPVFVVAAHSRCWETCEPIMPRTSRSARPP